ncbi:unnamed protein product [Schistosoma rodhaini]|uniref:EGF-like domain-containing protein n=1 Tax=Schistosoma rodhaini TaxID=6188 RepID=A0AA85GHA9_9TREM|nr:unnamed protein product [Schistosoma rodhaini]
MDAYKFYILLIVVLYSNLTKSSANKSAITQYEFLSKWKLKNNGFVNMDYGLPVNIIGGLIATVKLQFIRCKPEKVRYWTMVDCQALYIPSDCHFTYEQINLLKNTSKSINCSQHVKSKLIPNRWTKEVDKKSTQVVEIRVDSAITNMKLKAFFLHCGKDLAYFNNNSLIQLCDWDNYIELVSNINSLDVYGYINTSSIISVIYIYYFCTITWSELQKKSENKMRHILCPNSCSYGAVRCSGKPHVIKSVSNIKKSIPASIGDCIPIRLGVFDHEYKCLCEKGYSWNSDTRSCEIEDPCTLDQILSIEAYKIKGKDRLCDPKGTLRCIYTQYYRNKDIFGYQIRLTLHYSCICHPQFMGYRCDRLRNPCIENNLPNRVPGNEACRTYLGNKCNPINGTNHYTCTCVGNYKYSQKYSFYNCYERKNICDSILCQNKGMCVSSGDGKQFLCLCEYGWGGKYCTEPGIRQWFPWSPWSECSAAFYEDHGWKSRARECRLLGNESIYLGKCSGNEMELRTCIGRFPDFTKEYLPTIKVLLMFVCYLITLHLFVDIIYFLLQPERA